MKSKETYPTDFIPRGHELPLWERPPDLVQLILLDVLRGSPRPPIVVGLWCTLVDGGIRLTDDEGREHLLEEMYELSQLLRESATEVSFRVRLKQKDRVLSLLQRESVHMLVSAARRAQTVGGAMDSKSRTGG